MVASLAPARPRRCSIGSVLAPQHAAAFSPVSPSTSGTAYGGVAALSSSSTSIRAHVRGAPASSTPRGVVSHTPRHTVLRTTRYRDPPARSSAHRVALRFLVAPSRAHRPPTPTCWMLARVPSRYLRRLRLAQRGTMRLTSRLRRCRRSSPDVYLSDSEAFSGRPLDELDSPAESARDATVGAGMGSGRHSQVWYRSPVIQRGTLGIMMRFGVLRARRRRD
jgi:hypothetical protein